MLYGRLRSNRSVISDIKSVLFKRSNISRLLSLRD